MQKVNTYMGWNLDGVAGHGFVSHERDWGVGIGKREWMWMCELEVMAELSHREMVGKRTESVDQTESSEAGFTGVGGLVLVEFE